MRPKSLEVTRTSLTTCYTSLCYSCRCDTYSLYKGLLIKYWWLVKCRWCLTNTPWTPSTSSSSTNHLTIQMVVKHNTVSLRHKHSPETLFIHRKQFISNVLAFTSNARQLIHMLNHFFSTKNFIFPKFYLILFYFFQKFYFIHFFFEKIW